MLGADLLAATARLLEIDFEGYFACRIATDPDPSNEGRGMSGYTMALPRETRLDQIIRLQVDAEYLARNARPPLPDMAIRIGVGVTSVRYDGAPFAPAAQALAGATVELVGSDRPFADGPVFESRNNIVGNDDAMAFVIAPFHLVIRGPGATLTATDYLDPADPTRQTWQFTDPAAYARRISTCQVEGDAEVAEAVNVYDPYGYFRDRRRFLEREIARAEAALPGAEPATRARLEADIQGYRSRIFQLERWGDRVISKIQTRVDWRHDLNGPQTVTGALGGTADTGTPWRVAMWFGGWDGDLLIGYTRGRLTLPFLPA
ncbi:MAG: hypothetical protein HS111_05450 [Kofleriaceae bacterium]|nr:hypothetical protein [Kofleriaceae bacterium]MCL4228429.1 hypothetical protein [Myxococcales bacterium]